MEPLTGLELAREDLQIATIGELKLVYFELWGEEAHTANREDLITRILMRLREHTEQMMANEAAEVTHTPPASSREVVASKADEEKRQQTNSR